MFSQRILKSAVVMLLAACTAFAQTATKTAAAKTVRPAVGQACQKALRPWRKLRRS